jgi:hypothetical protein
MKRKSPSNPSTGLTMTTETWKTNRAVRKECIAPSWDEVENLIKHMSPDGCSSLTLERDDKQQMAIGGDGTNYVVHVISPDGELNQLTCAERVNGPNDLIALIVGGQESYSPAKYVVPRPYVLIAAKAFFQSGALSENVNWEVN